jgi:biotin transport system permease protein
MQSLYSDTPTWLHRVPAWSKLLCVALLSGGIFLTDQLQSLGVATVVCVAIFVSLGQATARVKPMLVGIALASVLLAVFHLYQAQIALAAITVMRLVSAVLLGLALTLTTRHTDLLHVFEQMLSPLRRLGVNTDQFALQISLMLRFTEHFFVQWRRLNDAYRLRTGESGGFKILAPLTIQMLLAARRVADALDLRLRR